MSKFDLLAKKVALKIMDRVLDALDELIDEFDDIVESEIREVEGQMEIVSSKLPSGWKIVQELE